MPADPAPGPTPVEELRAQGKAERKRVPRSSHAEYSPAPDRLDPVEILSAQNQERLPFLVPIRHQRMGASAFAFYRGTAAIMARDLAAGPMTGITTQLCGDAHLANFGGFASPERELVWDVNDFDETLPGPWEWDVKRLAASLVIAGRYAGLRGKRAAAAPGIALQHYQQAIRELAKMRRLDVWYYRVTAADVRRELGTKANVSRFDKAARKARRKTSLHSFRKLAEVVDGSPRLRSDPPLLVPLREIPEIVVGADWRGIVETAYTQYCSTVGEELATLLGRYRLADVALKVVGVGSVGTRCFVGLFTGRDESDPLLLQVKEAGPSVLEPVLGPSAYSHSGQRVVEGQRLSQAFGDIFLGYSSNPMANRDFYWRQLKDMKWSADVEAFDERQLKSYSALCGWTLARAHARGGDPIPIAAYIGKNDAFNRAVVRFAERYADQAAADFDAFSDAVASGRLVSEAPPDSPIRG